MRLVDADEAYKVLTDYYHHKTEIQHKALKEAIERVPIADAVEVVRCKDCIHYYADPWGYGNCVFEGGVSRRTKTSDFCSWGERREDGKTD